MNEPVVAGERRTENAKRVCHVANEASNITRYGIAPYMLGLPFYSVQCVLNTTK